MRKLILAFLLLVSINLISQNLVLNHEFDTNSGPDIFNNNTIAHWYSPSGGTSDLYYDGTEYYASFANMLDPLFVQLSAREHIQGTLSETLTEGDKVCVSFKTWVSPSAPYLTEHLHIAFFDSIIYDSSTNPSFSANLPIDISPANNQVNHIISSEFSYQALGGEKNFVIGFFEDNNSTSIYQNATGFQPSRYYIDSIVIKRCQLPSYIDTTNNSSKISETNFENEITLFPNPSIDGKLQIQINSIKKFDLKIYSITNSLIYQSEIDKSYSRIPYHFQKGIYTLNFSSKSTSFNKTVIIQ